jgi:hypothetical protein
MFFPFLEKISPPPNQKCKEHFSAGYASEASGGGAIQLPILKIGSSLVQ